jgi:7-carboxy-7-deazaguanine synthase (Cx14CxxC type)
MSYSVKEIYFTIQGEGGQAGRAAVFCRFAGCNLWSGREADRAKAVCQFCDTDFIGTDGPGGGSFKTAEDLAHAIQAAWNTHGAEGEACVVFTGGEPLLQLDEEAVQACHTLGIEVAVETNGTQPAPEGIDWLCVSPKAGSELIQTSGQELKLVFPQPGAMPEQFADLPYEKLFLQPMDGPDLDQNVAAAVAYCKAHPRWRLSLQTHKLIGIP